MFKITLNNMIVYVPESNIAYITERNDATICVHLVSKEVYEVTESQEINAIMHWAETLVLKGAW